MMVTLTLTRPLTQTRVVMRPGKRNCLEVAAGLPALVPHDCISISLTDAFTLAAPVIVTDPATLTVNNVITKLFKVIASVSPYTDRILFLRLPL